MVFEFSWQIGAGENSQIPVKSSTINSPSNDTIFTVGDEGAVRSTCPWGGENEEDEERWKFGWQQ